MRNRAYLRKMRAKHIKRKKRLSFYYWHVEHDGMLSKGKIHCSCLCCSQKTRNKGHRRNNHNGNYNPSYNWKHSDLLKIQSMSDEIKEFEQIS